MYLSNSYHVKSCWEIDGLLIQARYSFLLPPWQPGHGHGTSDQSIRDAIRTLQLEWVTQNSRDRRDIILTVAASTAVIANSEEQQGQQDGGACSSDTFLVVPSLVSSPDSPLRDDFVFGSGWLASMSAWLGQAQTLDGTACITHCLQGRGGWMQRLVSMNWRKTDNGWSIFVSLAPKTVPDT